jgi:hypothetical protein
VTTAQAITNASAGDTIQYLEGHSETVSATLTASKAGLHFISEGTAASRAVITTASAVPIFTISASGVWLENLTLTLTHASANCVLTSGAISGVQHVDCSFSASVASPALVSWASVVTGGRLSGCTFTSAATAVANRPAVGLLMGGACVDTEMASCTFVGGTYGWTDYAFKATGAQTRFTGIDVDLLQDSDLQFATGSVYKFYRRNSSGSANLEFTA